MRLGPHHLERGEKCKHLLVGLQQSHNDCYPRTGFELGGGGKHDSEFTVSYDIEQSYVALLDLQKRKKICH